MALSAFILARDITHILTDSIKVVRDNLNEISHSVRVLDVSLTLWVEMKTVKSRM
jgi:hypothetical protein